MFPSTLDCRDTTETNAVSHSYLGHHPPRDLPGDLMYTHIYIYICIEAKGGHANIPPCNRYGGKADTPHHPECLYKYVYIDIGIHVH
jgi:hypothetical protein